MLIYFRNSDGSGYQDGWIFGKLPGGHFQSKNLCCRSCTFNRAYFGRFPKKKLQHNFNMGGGVKGHLEFFQKFIRFLAWPVPYNAMVKRPWSQKMNKCGIIVTDIVHRTIAHMADIRVVCKICPLEKKKIGWNGVFLLHLHCTNKQ